MPFLMLGEALVDLICEQRRRARAAGPRSPAAPGRTRGASGCSSGCARRASTRAGSRSTRGARRRSPSTVAAGGEPSFAIYGEGISAALVAFGDRADESVGATEALVFASNTLVGPEREVTLRARDRARELGRPICFDPNLRLERWPSAEDAVEAARGCLEGCLLVKANANEARLLTGERDPAAAAEAIAALGVELLVITLGPDGALARGAVKHEVPGRAARVISTIGAGDAFFGTLLAGLQSTGWNPAAPSVPDTLGDAAEAGPRATESWGAVA